MHLLLIFCFALVTTVQAQQSVNSATSTNAYASVTAAERASLVNKFRKGIIRSEVSEKTNTTSNTAETFEVADMQSLKNKAAELKYKNDELERENRLLKQKLATVHIAYLITQNAVMKDPTVSRKGEKGPLLIDHFYDY